MLLVTSGLGKSSQVSFPTEMEPKIEKATSGKSSQVDLFVSSRAVSQNHRNLTKSNNIRMDVINETIDEEYKSFRVKRSLDENSDPKTDDVLSSIYVLVILSIMFLLEIGFNNVFYSDHLMQSLVHLISTLSDVREFNKTNHGLIFANTLHHSHNRQFLWTLFWLKNLTRILLVIIALSMTAHFHLSGHQLNIHSKNFQNTPMPP